MTRSIWMGPWDLEDRAPDAVLDELQQTGLDSCSLALRYHGGRMLLPRHPRRAVLEHASGEHFHHPSVAPFLRAAARRGFPVWAWMALCHDDAAPPRLAAQNAFADPFGYALCPSHPDVRDSLAAVCARAAAIDGVAGLDIEALAYMGYDHLSLHDKRGVPLDPETAWLLGLCFCPHCRPAAPGLAERVAATVRRRLAGNPCALDPAGFEPLLAHRQRMLLDLLARRKPARVNLRVSPDPLFQGGKTPLPLDLIAPHVERVTFTFFGAPLPRMEREAAALPPPAARPLPVHAGMVFHLPDCASEDDLRARLRVLTAAAPDGLGFYSYSMAGPAQMSWLANVLRSETR